MREYPVFIPCFHKNGAVVFIFWCACTCACFFSPHTQLNTVISLPTFLFASKGVSLKICPAVLSPRLMPVLTGCDITTRIFHSVCASSENGRAGVRKRNTVIISNYPSSLSMFSILAFVIFNCIPPLISSPHLSPPLSPRLCFPPFIYISTTSLPALFAVTLQHTRLISCHLPQLFHPAFPPLLLRLPPQIPCFMHPPTSAHVSLQTWRAEV